MTTTPDSGRWIAEPRARTVRSTTGPMVLVGLVPPVYRTTTSSRSPAVDSRHHIGRPGRSLRHERGPQAHASCPTRPDRRPLAPRRRRLHECVGRLDVHAGPASHAGRQRRRVGRGLGRPLRRASAAASAGASAAPSAGAGGAVVTIVARASSSRPPTVTVPANTAFTLEFDNQDAGHPARRPDQGRLGQPGVQDRHLPGRRQAQLPGPGPGRRQLPLRVHRPLQHDRHPDGAVTRSR